MTTTPAHVLIVEDEVKLANLLHDYFQQSHYSPHCIYHGDEVIDYVKNHPVNLILLDIMLPGKDGMQLCKELRQFTQLPIIMVTARVDEVDRLLGLELGADDYICKPFSPREVVARAKAVLRRSHTSYQAKESEFFLNEKTLEIHYQEHRIALTMVECQLIKLLCSEPGRIFSRSQLMNSMYRDHRIVSDRTIDSHIKKLRKKLSSSIVDKEFIHSVYGAGYRFDITEV